MKQWTSEKRYQELSQKLIDGNISASEQKELADWLNDHEDGTLDISIDFAKDSLELENKMLQGLLQKIEEVQEKKRLRIRSFSPYIKWIAAACFLLVITTAGYLFTQNKKTNTLVSHSTTIDLPPGSNKAILQLSDGSKVSLEDALPGQVAVEGDAKISKAQNGLINYQSLSEISNDTSHNTMMTPRGGQFTLRLSDGTMVWLNAASSITYPVVFNGKTRTVSITGEVYFEVANNASKPFVVHSSNQKIEVLGTAFNVNGYTDEPEMVATLAQGAIKINDDILQPGQGYRKGKIFQANLEQVLAWKNGAFHFDNLNLMQALRQISRWYNVDIKYEGKIPEKIFGGEIGRDLNLSQVLEILEGLEVKFRMNGNTLIVSG